MIQELMLSKGWTKDKEKVRPHVIGKTEQVEQYLQNHDYFILTVDYGLAAYSEQFLKGLDKESIKQCACIWGQPIEL